MNSQEHFFRLLRPLFRKDADFHHIARFTDGITCNCDTVGENDEA